MANPFIVFGLIIIVISIGFTLMHDFIITQYDCNDIRDQTLMLDCNNASNPITPSQFISVIIVGLGLTSFGVIKERKSIKIQNLGDVDHE